jgi:putative endonuclease
LTKERIALGKLGEDLAIKRIKKLGYRYIARNYRCSLGEIDIIAREGDCLVFIETKTRRGRSTGYAKEAVTDRKKRQLSKAALAYMKANDLNDSKARFDVVAVTLDEGGEHIELIRNAFDLAY